MTIDFTNQIVKRFTFAFAIIILGMSNSLSQSSIENPNKLVDFLGQEKFSDILNSNPSYLTFLDVKCSELIIVNELSAEKTSSFVQINEIKRTSWEQGLKAGDEVKRQVTVSVSPSQFLLDMESPNFNVLEYSFEQGRSNDKHFVLGSTGKVIIVRSIDFITEIANSRL